MPAHPVIMQARDSEEQAAASSSDVPMTDGMTETDGSTKVDETVPKQSKSGRNIKRKVLA